MPSSKNTQAVISSGVTPTADFATTPDIATLEVAQYDAIAVFFELTKGNGTVFTAKMLALDASDEEYDVLRVESGIAAIDSAAYTLTSDATQRFMLAWNVSALSKVKLQAILDVVTGSPSIDEVEVLGYKNDGMPENLTEVV